MNSPDAPLPAGRKTARAQINAAADWIVKTAPVNYAREEEQGETRMILQLDGFPWEAIEMAAQRLNSDGWVVEWGMCRTGRDLNKYRRAIALHNRADYINECVGKIGMKPAVGGFFSVVLALIGLFATRTGYSSQAVVCFTVATVLAVIWLWSRTTLSARRQLLRTKLENQQWKPIDRFPPDSIID